MFFFTSFLKLRTVSPASTLRKKSGLAVHTWTILELLLQCTHSQVLPDVPETNFLIEMSTHYTLFGTYDVIAARSCKHCFYT